MTAKPLDLALLIEPDLVGTYIANKYQEWDMFRGSRVQLWKEVLEYVFATDTTMTSNSKLPWSNKTTIPKLCQIRDNLHSNYMAALFPKQKWMTWEGDTEENDASDKTEAIESYMEWVVEKNNYYNIVSQLVYDYIDYGNVFTMPVWIDETNETKDMEQVGYVGPQLRRISPLDIVFDPTANAFSKTPKIIRSIVSIGEVKEMLVASSKDEEDRIANEALYAYLTKIRRVASNAQAIRGTDVVKDRTYQIAGFSSYHAYLLSNEIEVLTFYGDIYDGQRDTLLRNRVIKIVDRHKIIYNEPNTSVYGYAPIFHAGWRLRQDNLWAMGPLENLVGMQYRIDHLENMKADCFDLVAYPPLKITGHVEDFEWGPMERIYVGDDGNVELMSPNVQVLQADSQIDMLEKKMEEMAGSPKEAVGFRSPGEKTKYEVQSLENAASRVFQNKITFFERHIIEPSLNAMLELSRRNMNPTTVRVFNDEFKINVFKDLTRYDLTGVGVLKPMAARHFAEQANLVQNLNAFFASPAGQDQSVTQHFSGIKLAQMWEKLLEAEPFALVEPFIRLSEQADSQRLMQTHEQQLMQESQTASGIGADFDPTEVQ